MQKERERQRRLYALHLNSSIENCFGNHLPANNVSASIRPVPASVATPPSGNSYTQCEHLCVKRPNGLTDNCVLSGQKYFNEIVDREWGKRGKDREGSTAVA